MNTVGMRSACVPRRPYKPTGQMINVGVSVVSIGFVGVVTMGFILYFSVFMSPTLLSRIVHEVVQCDNVAVHFNSISHSNKIGHTKQLQGTKDANSMLEDTDSQAWNKGSGSHDGGSIIMQESGDSTSTKSRTKKFSILIGIMTMAKKTERRNLLRLAYGAQSSDIAHVTVKFILGKLKDDSEKTLVGLEKLVYGDVMELECEENMNNGKSFYYFSSLAAEGGSYDYVMKTDDDSYVRIANLAIHLSPLSRTDLYYGYILPCENQDPYKWYMAGMGYVISWDLVQWIRDSPIPRNRTEGTEDELVGKWFDEGGKARNRVNDKPLFYDHPEFGGKCAHELIPESILIHQVKTPQRWAQVLAYFEKDKLRVDSSKSRVGHHTQE
ncbi:hypothetical protein MPTK1_7g13990 [Marchantia polymorpha subsp. ruderalis]|uniref:Hexosyltransferase n=2 Tax=Marchantia polymorpha TaxID=3197 RepID=A0AAF6BZD3_MARPO|nr:hypothetical protein MARPO_0009s0084 [Marchantia polymorpha]BBN17367.1 hypothetical protein Mp_7g13990 [Marchantia polymorpha subsp. ruderalis]|eukprot:PTQ46972.1 hypothetical protein MARPO_0009s0084 [Marchantia polymorpha]